MTMQVMVMVVYTKWFKRKIYSGFECAWLYFPFPLPWDFWLFCGEGFLGLVASRAKDDDDDDDDVDVDFLLRAGFLPLLPLCPLLPLAG
jgi:hypothetical protein